MYRKLPINVLLRASYSRVTINRRLCLNSQLHQYPLSARILPVNEQRPSIIGSTSFVRLKYVKGKSSNKDEDDEEELSYDNDEDDKQLDKVSKSIKVGVNSLRADLIIKSGLGIARNKVEALFYESKIRVNGKKLLKKSSQVEVGDEIDVIKGVSQMNPDHLIVQRVEVLSAKPKEEAEGLMVKLRRFKSLTIENYEESPYKHDAPAEK